MLLEEHKFNNKQSMTILKKRYIQVFGQLHSLLEFSMARLANYVRLPEN